MPLLLQLVCCNAQQLLPFGLLHTLCLYLSLLHALIRLADTVLYVHIVLMQDLYTIDRLQNLCEQVSYNITYTISEPALHAKLFDFIITALRVFTQQLSPRMYCCFAIA
jgi:hypothetical protein